MGKYWLVPIVYEGTVMILSDERIALAPQPAAERFLQLAKSVHPRMLIPFKANLLLSDDSEAACGVDETPFDLASGKPIRFGDGMLELSHCAEAYLDKVPTTAEMRHHLQQCHELKAPATADEPIAGWLHTMNKWNEKGFSILLLN
ncbi:hypothetical protein DVH26_26105 [Paenibacillus sp. H1-7]|nr:hypothetical protein DVH26_26105 [Paenibacillus sp. H1-7]